MQNTFEHINEIVENLQLTLKDAQDLAQIEKDIILEKLRQIYAGLACNSVTTQPKPTAENKIAKPNPESVPEYNVHPGVEEDVDLFFEIGDNTDNIDEPEEEFAANPNPAPTPEKKSEPVIDEDDILQFITPKTTIKPIEQPKPVEQPKPIEQPKPVEQPKPIEQPKPQPTQPTTPVVETPKVAATAPQRSINDLFSEKSKDNSLGTQFQNSKVMDLTKSISVNDKFAFIKELFNNKGEEYSKAIQQLNQCTNIDAAFDCLEHYKREFFWDSTSNAYLTLCDLIRRKYK